MLTAQNASRSIFFSSLGIGRVLRPPWLTQYVDSKGTMEFFHARSDMSTTELINVLRFRFCAPFVGNSR